METVEEESSNTALPGVTKVVMIVGIVVSAVICFAVGLFVHKFYRNHHKKRVCETQMILLKLGSCQIRSVRCLC